MLMCLVPPGPRLNVPVFLLRYKSCAADCIPLYSRVYKVWWILERSNDYFSFPGGGRTPSTSESVLIPRVFTLLIPNQSYNCSITFVAFTQIKKQDGHRACKPNLPFKHTWPAFHYIICTYTENKPLFHPRRWATGKFNILSFNLA